MIFSSMAASSLFTVHALGGRDVHHGKVVAALMDLAIWLPL